MVAVVLALVLGVADLAPAAKLTANTTRYLWCMIGYGKKVDRQRCCHILGFCCDHIRNGMGLMQIFRILFPKELFPSDVKSVRQWVLWRRTRKYPTQNSLHRLRLYCFFWTVILTTKAVWFLSNRFGTWTELPGTWTRVADVSKKQTILSYYCYDACYYSRTCLNFRRIIFQHKQANKSIRCCRSMFGSRSRC